MVVSAMSCHVMVWGNSEADRNKGQGETLLKLQKRFLGIIAGKGGRYQADPLFAKYGILKMGDLYRQQLRIHAWKFHNGHLPDSQGAMLARVGESHSYGTQVACSGLVVSTGDRRLVFYGVPTEWGTLTEEQEGGRFDGGAQRLHFWSSMRPSSVAWWAAGFFGVDCFCLLLLPCGVSPAHCRRGLGKKQTENMEKKTQKTTENQKRKTGIPVKEANAD
jgi:hypothetical protein